MVNKKHFSFFRFQLHMKSDEKKRILMTILFFFSDAQKKTIGNSVLITQKWRSSVWIRCARGMLPIWSDEEHEKKPDHLWISNVSRFKRTVKQGCFEEIKETSRLHTWPIRRGIKRHFRSKNIFKLRFFFGKNNFPKVITSWKWTNEMMK